MRVALVLKVLVGLKFPQPSHNVRLVHAAMGCFQMDHICHLCDL